MARRAPGRPRARGKYTHSPTTVMVMSECLRAFHTAVMVCARLHQRTTIPPPLLPPPGGTGGPHIVASQPEVFPLARIPMWFYQSCLLFIVCAWATCSAPVVQTTCGAVSGTTATLPYSGESAYRYNSIPFAAPPVGPLRFRPPQPLCPWHGTINGTLPHPSCVQPSGSGSEDCLYLSVSTPTNHTGPPLPVLVYCASSYRRAPNPRPPPPPF